MVKRHIPLETGETVCPACGAGIRVTPSARRRRVQCPKCREVVLLEDASVPESDLPPSPAPAPPAALNVETLKRVELLEARVEALEITLREAMAARPPAPSEPQRKLLWVTTIPGRAPEFSPEQERALLHNLSGVRSQAMTIRTPADDPMALARAEWFKSIFERAGWAVRGPEEIAPGPATSSLKLAVPELPVAKEAAAMYLALKAAGFEPIPVIDNSPRSETPEEATALSLTVPSANSA
jgi:hypothetical protein